MTWHQKKKNKIKDWVGSVTLRAVSEDCFHICHKRDRMLRGETAHSESLHGECGDGWDVTPCSFVPPFFWAVGRLMEQLGFLDVAGFESVHVT